MKNLCFYFQIHQPFRLKKFRFFDIGNDDYYYDDFANRTIMHKVAERCYIPMNNLILELIAKYGDKVKFSFSISGTAIEQFEMFTPHVLDSFIELSKTGNVEFLAETYAHGLSSIKHKEEFFSQVNRHATKIESLFGIKPRAFRNTELIYSDTIGELIGELGYNTVLTEGAKHVLGWKSPNFLYCNAINPRVKVLTRNFRLSDDISFRFSNRAWDQWPLTTEKYAQWLNNIKSNEETVNIFIDYETFGEHQWAETGIFDFMKNLPEAIFKHTDFTFATPTEVAEKLNPVAAIHVPYPISWADEERDLTAWLGNDLQEDAFNTLFGIANQIRNIDDPKLQRNWNYLQTSDHLYYMCTKWFSDGEVHKYFNPYGSPYDAYINYMNIVSDFIIRINKYSGIKVEIPEKNKDKKRLSIAPPVTENFTPTKEKEKGKEKKKEKRVKKSDKKKD